jgi:hypothetical protein
MIDIKEAARIEYEKALSDVQRKNNTFWLIWELAFKRGYEHKQNESNADKSGL